MLDFEMKVFDRLRKDIETRRNTTPQSLYVRWSRTIPVPFGPVAAACLPGYAGHNVLIRNNIISTYVYLDWGGGLTGEKLLGTEEIREVTYAVERWNLDDEGVTWLGDGLYCHYDIFPGVLSPSGHWASYRWRNDAASIPASVANLVAVLRKLAAMVQSVTT